MRLLRLGVEPVDHARQPGRHARLVPRVVAGKAPETLFHLQVRDDAVPVRAVERQRVADQLRPLPDRAVPVAAEPRLPELDDEEDAAVRRDLIGVGRLRRMKHQRRRDRLE
jgi:hypothetical protein